MKDTFYFSHDYTARTDPKIKRLISKHGIAGYGIFWAIVEELYINANALPLQYDTIAYDLRTDEKIIKSVINDFDLFVIKDNLFGSISVQKRLELRNEKSAKARQSALKRWNKDANAMQTQSECNAIKKRKRKEKEIIENKINIEFEIFWNIYNKKVGDKIGCEKKWIKLLDIDREKIIKIMPEYLSQFTEKQFQPYPETFLNQRRWENEIIKKETELKGM